MRLVVFWQPDRNSFNRMGFTWPSTNVMLVPPGCAVKSMNSCSKRPKKLGLPEEDGMAGKTSQRSMVLLGLGILENYSDWLYVGQNATGLPFAFSTSETPAFSP